MASRHCGETSCKYGCRHNTHSRRRALAGVLVDSFAEIASAHFRRGPDLGRRSFGDTAVIENGDALGEIETFISCSMTRRVRSRGRSSISLAISAVSAAHPAVTRRATGSWGRSPAQVRSRAGAACRRAGCGRRCRDRRKADTFGECGCVTWISPQLPKDRQRWRPSADRHSYRKVFGTVKSGTDCSSGSFASVRRAPRVGGKR